MMLLAGLAAAPAAADRDGDHEGEHADAPRHEGREHDHTEQRHDGDREGEARGERRGDGDRAGEDDEGRGGRDREREHAEGRREGDRENERGDQWRGGDREGRRDRPGLLDQGAGRRSTEAIAPGPFAPERDDRRVDPPPLDEAQREAALEVLADVYPRFAERLNEAQEANPRRAEWALRKMWPRLHRLVELRDRDPALYKLRVADQRHKVETLRLVHQLRRALRQGEAPGRVSALQDRLRERVNDHFEVRQRMRRHELEQLAERIEQLRAELRQRQANRDQLIGRYIEALLKRQRRDEAGHRRPDLDDAEE